MQNPDALATQAQAVLERAKRRLADIEEQNRADDEALIYELAKVLAAMVAQERARWGEESSAAMFNTGILLGKVLIP